MSALPNEITGDPRYRALSTRRDEAAKRSRSSQSTYRWLTASFVAATAAAAIGSALTLYGMETSKPTDFSAILRAWVADPAHRRVLLVLVGAALGMAAFAQHRLRTGSFGSDWTKQRVEAEKLRLERERLALRIGHERGPDTFRQAGTEFQGFLDKQIEHHRKSADRHRASSRSLGLVTAGMAALVAIAGAVAAVGGGIVVVAVALVGVCAPALVAALKSWSEATSDIQRAELHEGTWGLLLGEQGRLPEFTAAVEAGDLDAALAHAERTFDVLRRDTSEFQQIRSAAPKT